MSRWVRWLVFLLCILRAPDLYAWQEVVVYHDSVHTESQEEVVQLREIPTTHWDKIRKDKGFIYSKPKLKPIKQKKNWDLSWLKALSPFLKILLYVLVAICIGVILYSILRNSEFNYFKKAKKKEPLVHGEEEDLPTDRDWERALNDALAKGNYRLAVRLLYLQTLHLLDQQQLIFYKQDKTNWEYVNQLRTTPFSDRFIQLTKYFDYVWYGHFVIDEKEFKHLNEIFRSFQKEVDS